MGWYVKAVKQGDAVGQFNVGQLHHHGLGVPLDCAQAMDRYLKTADQGYFPAQCGIGDLYTGDHVVPRDYTKALEWYRKTAAQGHEESIKRVQEPQQSVDKDEDNKKKTSSKLKFWKS
ncbi:hypothetical protein BGX29_005487 [Mortierella sp. GBA35]|nr:hypothetical protein BGX29_005487 [Mortierella sp. GBA35]